MKPQVKDLLLGHLKNLTVPSRYTGFTIIEEVFQLYQLHNFDKRVTLHPVQYPPSLQVSNEVLIWAGLSKDDLTKLGLQISYYEDVIKENFAIITQLNLLDWIERVL